MAINIKVSDQYQGVIETAGSPQNSGIVGGSVGTVTLSSTNTAAQNTALIQAALDLAGDVHLAGSGTCLVNTPLIVYSNTNLTKDLDFIIKQANDQNENLIVNSAQRVVPTNVTLTYTSGRALSIGWTSHGLVVNDYVSVEGVSPAEFIVVARVETVTDANNIVVRLPRMPRSSVPSAVNKDFTTAGAAIKARKCDVNININMYGLDNNYTNQAPSVSWKLHGCCFGFIANSKISMHVNGTAKYSTNFGAATNCEFEDIGTSANSDLVKAYGPLLNCKFNVIGSSSDDGISLQTREPLVYVSYCWTYGNILNCEVRGNVKSSVHPFGVYTSPDEYVDNITFYKPVGFASDTGGASIKIWGNISDNIAPITGTLSIATNAVVGVGTAFVNELHVGQILYNAGSAIGTVSVITDNTHATVTGGVNTTAGTTVKGSPGKTSGYFGKIEVIGLNSEGRDIGGQVAGEGLNIQYTTGLELNFDATFDPQATGVSCTSVANNTYLKKFNSSIRFEKNNVVHSGYFNYINGTVENFLMDGSNINNGLASSGDGVFLGPNSDVPNISLIGCNLVGLNNPVLLGASTRRRVNIIATGNYVDCNKLVYCTSSLGYSLSVAANTFSGMYNGITRGGTGTWTADLKSGGNNMINGSIWSVPITPASYVIRLYGVDIVADINSHPKTVAGQMCIASVAAGTIVAGNTVVCDGTNWRQVSDTTKLL